MTEDDKNLRHTESGKLIITNYRGRMCAMLLQNDRLTSIRVLSGNSGKIGAVYIGKVKNVVKNINACFVEIADEEICYLPFKQIETPEVLNRTFDGRLIEGDELLVQITKDAQKTKQATVSAILNGIDNDLLQKAKYRTCFSCMKEAPSELESFITETKDLFCEIVTDDNDYHALLKELCDKINFNVSIRIYQDSQLSLSSIYGIQSKMDIALERRIWLKSGAYLIIEPTEALTVIDVNTGKYDAKKEIDETFRRINIEAAEEIALQIKLRNLSGIILVDFINMKRREDKSMLIEYMKELVSTDPVKTTIVDMTPLGLLEITRQKYNKPLREYFRINNV